MIKREDIKYRVGRVGKKGQETYATFLIYIDARTAMEELDNEVGKCNWQFNWEKVENDKWAIRGNLKIYNKDLSVWIEYSDVGYPQDAKMMEFDKSTKKRIEKDNNSSEWLKDAISDALKRTSVFVCPSVRTLYDAPFLYTEEVILDDYGNYKKLTNTGTQMIEGNIDKWYQKIIK